MFSIHFRRFWYILIVASLFFISSACSKNKDVEEYKKIEEQIKNKQYDEALQTLILFFNIYENSDLRDKALFELATINYYLKNYYQAISYYEMLIRSYSNSDYYLRSLDDLINIYINKDQKNLTKASKFLNIYIAALSNKDFNKKILAQFKLADVYLELKFKNQARKVYKDIIILCEGNPELLKIIAFAYFKIGVSYESEGYAKLAILTYNEVEQKTQYSKLSVYSAINLAKLYESQEEFDKAKKVRETIISRLDKNDPLYNIYSE